MEARAGRSSDKRVMLFTAIITFKSTAIFPLLIYLRKSAGKASAP
jgi:hypothetical protein